MQWPLPRTGSPCSVSKRSDNRPGPERVSIGRSAVAMPADLAVDDLLDLVEEVGDEPEVPLVVAGHELAPGFGDRQIV
jgi:hypothetical protein